MVVPRGLSFLSGEMGDEAFMNLKVLYNNAAAAEDGGGKDGRRKALLEPLSLAVSSPSHFIPKSNSRISIAMGGLTKL